MVISAVQFSKIPSSPVVGGVSFKKRTALSELQFLKAELAIKVTELGITISAREVQSSKALYEITLTALPILISVSE